ncbi:MAG: hypothetical protein WC327_02745 [Candidatus Cloacimonadia bacterium]
MKKIDKYLWVAFALIPFMLLFNGCRIVGPDGWGGNQHNIYQVSSIDTPGHAYAVDVYNGYAYVADGVGGLRLFDVTNPYYPKNYGAFDSDGIVYDVKYGGDDLIYLASGSAGVEVVDTFSLFGPRLAGSYMTYNAFGLDYAGKYLYVGDDQAGVRILDVSNPYMIYQMSSKLVSGMNVYNTKLYWPYLFACSRYGLSILDITNQSHPSELYFQNIGYVYDVEVVNHIAYVAYEDGLIIYDLDNISKPKELGFCFLPAIARSIAVRGDYAYIALGQSGLSIVDISDPTHPREIGYYMTANCEMNNIFLGGRYIYVANGAEGLLILEHLGGN